VKHEVEKLTVTKDRVRVLDIDRLLELIVNQYLKYAFILNNEFDLIFHSFTLLENYNMSYNEMMMLIEWLDSQKFRVDTDQSKSVEIDKKDLQKILEQRFNDHGLVHISLS